MTTIDEGLRCRILKAPGERYDAIVRTDAYTEEIAEQCARRGIEVHRTFRLVPGLAVTARGEELLALADNPHVTRIEADREVGIR